MVWGMIYYHKAVFGVMRKQRISFVEKAQENR